MAKFSDLIVRAISGIVFVAIMVFCTVCRPWTLFALMGLLAALGVDEFLNISRKAWPDGEHGTLKAKILGIIEAEVPFLVAEVPFMMLAGQQLRNTGTPCPMPTTDAAFHLLAITVVVWLLAFMAQAVAYLFKPVERPIERLGTSVLAQVYVTLPLMCIAMMALLHSEPFWVFPLALYVFLWIDDSGAYLTGSMLGKHKLMPRVSPGKTWEGSIGGAVLALTAAVIMAKLFPFMPLWKWLGMAATVVVTGTLGDLVESLFKRSLGLKDSGHIMPGHGGILDRIDSMLFAAPATLVYLLLIL